MLKRKGEGGQLFIVPLTCFTLGSTYCHWCILGAWHLLYIVTSYRSTASNTLAPLITCCECCHSAIRFLTINIECDTLLKTLDHSDHSFLFICLCNECLGKEVNSTDGVGELHLSGLVADELSIGHLVPCGSVSGHFVRWHTGDSVATDLTLKLTPCLYSLVHDAIVLTIHALGSRTLATLAEVHNRVLGSVHGVDLDLVV